MLPYTPTPVSTAPSANDSMLRNFPGYPHANRFYNEAPEEVREANMPTTVGILPLTLREGNPMSTRFLWPAPLHQYLWRDLQQGEIPGTPHFQLYPQPPQRQRVDIARFQRAMLSHIQPSLSSAASTFTGSTVSLRVDNAPSSTASQTPGVTAGSSAPDQDVTVDSDSESVDTTAAVVFSPANKMKKAIEKRKALAMALGSLAQPNERGTKE